MASELSPRPPRAAPSRAATAVEAEIAGRALTASRRVVWGGTVFLLALALVLGGVVAAEESVGVGVLIGVVMTAVALGLPWLLRGVLRQQATDRVERVAGDLAQVPSAEGTFGYLLGTDRVTLPPHWRPYLPEGEPVQAEGLRIEVPGRPPVYHLVTAESPRVERRLLSLERELEEGLGRLHGSAGLLISIVGAVAVLVGLSLAIAFSGVGAVAADPAWAGGWAAVAVVGLAVWSAAAVPLLRLRSRAWVLYHDPTTPPPPMVGRTAWTVAAWGAVAMALGLRMLGLPLWSGALVGAVGFLPVGVLAALRPTAA